MGLRSKESPSTSSSGAVPKQSFAAISPYERRSKRRADINNAVSYFFCEKHDAFLAKKYIMWLNDVHKLKCAA